MGGLVQIRNVPDDVRRVVKSKAAARGESLNEYLLALLVRDASRPTTAEVFARAAARSERATGSAVGALGGERHAREDHVSGRSEA